MAVLEGWAPFQRDQVLNLADCPRLVGDRCLVPRFLCKSQLCDIQSLHQVIKKLSHVQDMAKLLASLDSVPCLYVCRVKYIKV